MPDGRFAATLYQSIGSGVLTELVSAYVDGMPVAQATTNPITSVRTSTVTDIHYIASDLVGGIDEVCVFSRTR